MLIFLLSHQVYFSVISSTKMHVSFPPPKNNFNFDLLLSGLTQTLPEANALVCFCSAGYYSQMEA